MILSFIRLFERKILFMKKTKILVPAMAVLALGMAAAVTGTVAWFSANTVVTASNMSVSCSTSKSLVIDASTANGTGWAVSKTSTTGNGDAAHALIPASNASIETPAFWGVKDNSKVNDDGSYREDTPIIKFNSANSGALVEGYNSVTLEQDKTFYYCRLDTFYIKLDAPSTEKVDLKVNTFSITTGTLDITNSLRLGMRAYYLAAGANDTATLAGQGVYQAGAEKIYAKAQPESTAKPITNVTEEGNVYTVTEAAAAPTTVTTFANTVLKENFGGQDIVKVQFLWWYEGQDDDCITANAITSEEISLSVSFTYSDVNA